MKRLIGVAVLTILTGCGTVHVKSNYPMPVFPARPVLHFVQEYDNICLTLPEMQSLVKYAIELEAELQKAQVTIEVINQ